jgi:hypothetical protein
MSKTTQTKSDLFDFLRQEWQFHHNLGVNMYRLSVAIFSVLMACGAENDDFIGEPVHLSDYDESLCDSVIFPDPGEENDIAVSSFEVQEDFAVDRVEITLRAATMGGDSPDCESEGTHEVVLWVQSEQQPDVSPEMIVLSGDAASSFSARLQVDVSPPLEVLAGDRVFAGLRFQGPTPNISCLVGCTGGTRGENSWFSGASSAPFEWYGVRTFANTDLQISVHGNTTAP